MPADLERRAAYLRAYRERYRAYLREKARLERSTEHGKKLLAARIKRYRKKHSERVRAQRKAYHERNKDKRAVYTRVRAKRHRHATPPWADMNAIREIYAQARATGKVVDHIIPLCGKLVCGLHVENNLQLLTRLQNGRKANKFTPKVTYG